MKKVDYSNTVNLPKTDFPMKANLPMREPEILSFWEKEKVYDQLLQKNKNNTIFFLHDGPPYANAPIHIGHALNKILKDIIVKYNSMKGFLVPFIPGWDCHGLPIEYQLMKEMKADKHKVDKLQFRKEARKFAQKYIEIQKKDFQRLGVFGTWEKPYLTMSPLYETVIIDTFQQLLKRGYIYRAKKPVYWCIHCETALAEAEVEYADHISPSIIVKFPVLELPKGIVGTLPLTDTAVLIWTTTPWTLPGNVALAFHPQQVYAVVELYLNNKLQRLLLLYSRLEAVLDSIGVKDYKVVRTLKGVELEGIRCNNVLTGNISVGILADFVSTEEGTGVVHIAPGHGLEDYQIGLKYGLPVISPVDDSGVFTSEVKEFAGKKVFVANKLIINKLANLEMLLSEEKITHSYPHCWRCKEAIIFRATEQWFLNVNHDNLRERLLRQIKNVTWIPEGGANRISSMIEMRPDWCLSRQRLWGVPIPVIYCNNCGKVISPEKTLLDIVAKEGSDAWFEYPVEEFIPEGCTCGNKSAFRKEEDILDVWFDSGVSFNAVVRASYGYSQADMYLEGSDQHRGWFQTSLIPAVAIDNTPPYKIVLTHGFVVDGEGRKMSKSLGNVIGPQEIVSKYGADVLRLWVAGSDYREDIKISEEIIQRLVESYRKIRNTIRFLLGNIYDFDIERDKFSLSDMYEIDKWALHRLHRLIRDVTQAYEDYEFHRVISLINSFCINDLSSFYLDVLKDRLYTFHPNSKARRACQCVLYEILTVLLKLLAPILSFTAEESWQYISKTQKSIFLESYPEVQEDKISEVIEQEWQELLNLREKVNLSLEVARKSNIIGSSLEAKICITSHIDELSGLLRKYFDSLPMIFIVSQVEVKEDTSLNEPKIEVEHAAGKKCLRCWNWSVEVNEKNICPRCQKIISEL